MDNTRSDSIPLAVQPMAARASEVLVCFSAHLPAGLAESLRALAPPATPLEFQCPPSIGLEVIMALLESGHRVFEARSIPPATQVFIDRRHGFRLPDWAALPDPFGAACKLAWSRVAAFTRVAGTIRVVETSLTADFAIVRLAENPQLRLSVPISVGLPAIDQRAAFLGRHDFNFGVETPLLECVALFDDAGGASDVE